MRLPLLCLGALLLGGCGPTLDEQNPDTLKDQSGATWTWDCTGRHCELGPLPECPDEGDEPAVIWWGGRFFGIATSCTGPGSSHATDERFTVCTTDADCPRLTDYSNGPTYECRAGFCQRDDHAKFPPDQLPNEFDMAKLCYGATPRTQRPASWPAELNAAVAAACPDEDPLAPCESVPPGCPDPRVGASTP
jgi:hypothetical protein